MSQSRNRRMSSLNREAGSGTRAGPPDRNPTDFVTNARTLDSKSTNKISKELRYDLENALLGLCDVWFDEIKPHLVKNNLKVHTGGALNENYYGDLGMTGDRGGANRGDGRRDLEPGAASDQIPGSCEAFSPTPRVELNAPCHRRPAPCRPTPLSPSEFHNLLIKSISRIKARRKATQKESQSPPLQIQPTVMRAVRHPRCTACGFVSSQGQVSKTPVRHQSDRTLLSWTHAAGSQRPIRTNNLLLSRPQCTSFQRTKPCAVDKRLSTIESVSDLSRQCEATKSPTSEITRSQLKAKIQTPNFTDCPPPTLPRFERKSPSPHRIVVKSSSPRRTTGNSPSRPRTPNVLTHSSPDAKAPKNKRPVSPPPKPSTRIVVESGAAAPWLQGTSQNNWLPKSRDQKRRATNNSPTLNKNLRPASSNIILFPVKHQRKKQFDGKSSLFSKDLINLIGEKYDARLQVLYQNPKREESYPSIMCLSGRKLFTTKNTWK